MSKKPESKSARRVAPAKLDVAPKGRGGRVPTIKPGKYADGLPLHEIQYLESKIILRPNGFTSRKSLENFGKLLRRPARQAGVGFEPCDFANQPLQIREVLFLDTEDFRLYNNAFILRRRVPYSEGFPIGDPEIVFKFRHPEIQKAAETDVRPQILGDYRIKFKAEALPLKDGLGGMRLLYSHNVEFGLSAIHEGDANSMDTLVNLLPVLGSLKRSPGRKSSSSAVPSSRKFCRTSRSWISARASRPWPTSPCGGPGAIIVLSSGSSRSRSSSNAARSSTPGP